MGALYIEMIFETMEIEKLKKLGGDIPTLIKNSQRPFVVYGEVLR